MNNDDDLIKRFGWWWRHKRILCRIGRQLEQAAFYYELSSRADNGDRPLYLLGKPFHKLTRAQMWEMNRYWPRRPRNITTFYVMRYVEEPFELKNLRQELGKIRSRWSDERRMIATISPPTRKEIEVTEKCERAHAQETGWTLPLYFSFNLKECGNTTILEHLEAHLKKERERLGITAPKANKGRSNRSIKGISFRAIEALDVRRKCPRKHAEQNLYDPTGGAARRAARKAKQLRAEWEANVRMWHKHDDDEARW